MLCQFGITNAYIVALCASILCKEVAVCVLMPFAARLFHSFFGQMCAINRLPVPLLSLHCIDQAAIVAILTFVFPRLLHIS